MSSPSEVITSSPTTTLPIPTFWSWSAPSIVSWSVRNTGARPKRRHRAATPSGSLLQSNEAELCTWRSTLTKATLKVSAIAGDP